jgi:hypothetical protein
VDSGATFARRSRPALLAAVALGGCVCTHVGSQDQGLSLTAVEPPFAVAGVKTPLLLRGDGFRPRVVTNLEGKDATAEVLSVRVGPSELADAMLRPDGVIEATLPDTLPPGIYEIAIVLGRRQTIVGAAVQVVAPIEVTLSAPADLASGEQRPFSLEVTSRAPANVVLALDSLGMWPAGFAAASGLGVPVMVGPQGLVKVFGNLLSMHPAATQAAGLAVSVRWSLGPLTGTVDASTSLRAFGTPGMTASIDGPAEIEVGDQRPISARLVAPPDVDLGHVNVDVTAGGSAGLTANLSVSGATLAAGSGLSLSGTMQGVTVGPGWLQLYGTAVAQRGDSPSPVSLRRAVTVRGGPAPALSGLSLPGIVEVGVPVTVSIDVRNDGDVALNSAQLNVSATDGTVSPAATSLALAAGARLRQTFSVTPQTAGAPVRVTVALSGVSAISGRTFVAQSASASSGAARRPAALAIAASPSQPRASKGQKVPLTVKISNTGDVDVPAAVLSIAASGSGLVLDASGAPVTNVQLPPTSVPAGGSVTLSPVALGNSVARASFALFVSGNDGVSGAQVTASATVGFDVQAGTLLSLSVSGPARLVGGQSAALDVLVRNDGDVDGVSLAPSTQVSGPISAGSPSPGSVARLAAGASVHFSIPVLAGTPAGSASVTVSASAQDGNGAGPVTASGSLGIVIHDPPRITASFTGSLPATATEGQVLPAMLHLSAVGPPSADARLVALPSLTISGNGTASAQAPCALPCTLPAGGAMDIPVQITAGIAGSLQVTASFAQAFVDADQGAPVSVASVSTTAVQVQSPGALAIQVRAPQLVEGFNATLTVEVSNTGGAEVSGLTLGTLDVTNAAGLPVSHGPATLPAGPLAGGARTSFTFDVVPPPGAGTLTVHVRVTGTETNTSAQRIGDVTSAPPFPVLRPGGLIADLRGLPATASVGQALTLLVVVTNSGQTTVTAAIASLSQRGSLTDGSLAITGPAEPAQDLAASASATFTFKATVTAAGPVHLTAGASGTLQGGGAATVSTSTGDLTAQAPAQLTATLTPDRTRVSVGQVLRLTLVVQNTGGTDAVNVSATAPGTASGTTATVGAITAVAAGSVAVLRAGQSASFTWSTSATSAGQAIFVSSAQGTDGNDATMKPSTGTVTSAAVQAQTPGKLALSATAAPARVSAGLQRASLTMTTTNSGGADVTLAALPSPTVLTTGSAAVALASQPASAAGLVLRSGESRDFIWTFDASGSGTVYWQVSATATESNTGETLAPAPVTSGTIAVEAPAALTLSLAASPLSVSAGLQRVQLALTCRNPGGASLRLDALPAPTAVTTGTAAAAVASSPPSAAGTVLAGGASQTFTWAYDVSASGNITFSSAASGTDTNSGTAVRPPAATAAAVQVQAPAALSATATASPARVSAGLQQVSFVLTLQNTGGAGLRLDALPSPVVTTGGTATAALSSSPPSPAGDVLGGGATRSFTWVWNVSGSGTLGFSVSPSGTDTNAGTAVGPISAASQAVTVQTPGALSISASVSPASASANQNLVSFTLIARNTGGADVKLDALPAPTVAPTGTASATVSVAPASAAGTVLAGGASASFTWQYSVSGSGTLSFTGSVSGVEANTQGALKPAPVTSSPVTVQQPGRLSLSASATPAQVSAGLQQISLSLSVQNTGEADVVLDALPLPAVTPTGSASANVATSPAGTAGTVVPGGVTKTFNWTWNVGGVGTVSFSASATGRDGNSGNAVAPAPAPAGPVTVQTSGALSLSIAASPTQVSAGLQQVSVTLSVTNTGGDRGGHSRLLASLACRQRPGRRSDPLVCLDVFNLRLRHAGVHGGRQRQGRELRQHHLAHASHVADRRGAGAGNALRHRLGDAGEDLGGTAAVVVRALAQQRRRSGGAPECAALARRLDDGERGRDAGIRSRLAGRDAARRGRIGDVHLAVRRLGQRHALVLRLCKRERRKQRHRACAGTRVGGPEHSATARKALALRLAEPLHGLRRPAAAATHAERHQWRRGRAGAGGASHASRHHHWHGERLDRLEPRFPGGHRPRRRRDAVVRLDLLGRRERDPFLQRLGFRHRRQREHLRDRAGRDCRTRHGAEAGEHRDRLRKRHAFARSPRRSHRRRGGRAQRWRGCGAPRAALGRLGQRHRLPVRPASRGADGPGQRQRRVSHPLHRAVGGNLHPDGRRNGHRGQCRNCPQRGRRHLGGDQHHCRPRGNHLSGQQRDAAGRRVSQRRSERVEHRGRGDHPALALGHGSRYGRRAGQHFRNAPDGRGELLRIGERRRRGRQHHHARGQRDRRCRSDRLLGPRGDHHRSSGDARASLPPLASNQPCPGPVGGGEVGSAAQRRNVC